jgi:hypothetical protein
MRLAWGASGLMWFLWLGVEDRGLAAVLLLASALAATFGLTALARAVGGKSRPRRVWLTASTAAGLLSGLAVAPLAALLILIKTALHQHPVPDFRPEDLVTVLRLTPGWSISGLLVGAGGGLFVVGRAPPNTEDG